jgi:hypothetical protein
MDDALNPEMKNKVQFLNLRAMGIILEFNIDVIIQTVSLKMEIS